MPVKVVSLGFLALNAVKQDEMTHHYQNVLGLPIVHDTGNGETYFGCGHGHHALSLHRADRPGFRHVGLQIAGAGPLDDALAALRAAGVPAQVKSDPVAGIKSCIEIADPDGSTVYLYREAATVIGGCPSGAASARASSGTSPCAPATRSAARHSTSTSSASSCRTGWGISSCSCAAMSTITP